MALTNLAVFGGAFCTPILAGKITKTIGWPWTFYLTAIFCGACLPALVFFVPETAYRRSAHLNTDFASSDEVRLRSKQDEPGYEQRNSQNEGSLPEQPLNTAEADTGAEKNIVDATNRAATTDEATPKKVSYVQSLKPFNGRKTDESFWKLFLRPFPLFAHPAILWCCLTQGTLIGWTVFIGVMLGSIFLGPPLWWDEVNTGYAYAGPLVGAFLGFLVVGALADWSAKLMTRRNNGVYEPEFRIVLVIPQLIIGSAGLFGFGIVAPNIVEYFWFWPIFFFGMVVMGMVIGAVASALYIVDAHRMLPPTY
jgi:MFS family permease